MSYPILLCTYTNVAVDNLVEGLANTTLDALRIGYNGKVKSTLIEHTLEKKLETHPLAFSYKKLKDDMEERMQRKKNLEQRIRELQKNTNRRHIARLDAMELDSIGLERQIHSLETRAWGLFRRMVRDIVTAADVVRVIWPS